MVGDFDILSRLIEHGDKNEEECRIIKQLYTPTWPS